MHRQLLNATDLGERLDRILRATKVDHSSSIPDTRVARLLLVHARFGCANGAVGHSCRKPEARKTLLLAHCAQPGVMLTCVL